MKKFGQCMSMLWVSCYHDHTHMDFHKLVTYISFAALIVLWLTVFRSWEA